MSKILTLQDLYQDLRTNNIEVDLVPSDTISINESMECSGSFDGEKLQIAIFHPAFIPTFLHEYCHFLQSKEGLWNSEAENQAFIVFDSWINGEIELSLPEVNMCMRVIQACELDCERRTIQLIKDMQLNYSTELYAQQANAYVLFYELSVKYRKWSSRGNPAGHPAVYSICSETLVDSITETSKCVKDNQSELFEKLVIEHCL